jgi:hypothetical protein
LMTLWADGLDAVEGLVQLPCAVCAASRRWRRGSVVGLQADLPNRAGRRSSAGPGK